MPHPHKPLFIFGSTGDLVKRKVLPALSALRGFDLEVITLGRKDLTTKEYRELVTDGDCSKDFLQKHLYVKVDLENPNVPEDFYRYLSKRTTNYFYSALPPAQIKSVIGHVSQIKRRGYKVSLLMEKPFGSSLREALALKKLLKKEQLTSHTLISDHYLFKKEVLALKRQPFKKLKIVSLEEVGLEKRAGYYDDIGALRDMLQSHFLNIAFKLTGTSRAQFTKLTTLLHQRGQYHSYTQELGKPSDTETFVRVVAKIGNKEFEFITGKKFDRKLGYIAVDDKVVHFDSNDNSYISLFKDFLSNKKERFATVDASILGWEITESLARKRPQLVLYPAGSPSKDFLYPFSI
jgi:glucose-6-phosphate 1-dehydrogenase